MLLTLTTFLPSTDISIACDCIYLDAAPCHDAQNIKRTRPMTPTWPLEAILGPSWGHFGAILGPLGAILGRNSREWPRALDVLGVMARSSIQIDTITCNAAVSACEKGGERAHALDILGNMARSSIAMATITCNAAVSACEKGGECQ